MRTRWIRRRVRRAEDDIWFDAMFLAAWFALAYLLGAITPSLLRPLPANVAASHAVPAR